MEIGAGKKHLEFSMVANIQMQVASQELPHSMQVLSGGSRAHRTHYSTAHHTCIVYRITAMWRCAVVWPCVVHVHGVPGNANRSDEN